MVTSACPFLDAQQAEQLAQVVEGNVRVRSPAQYAGQKIIALGHGTDLQQLSGH